MAELKEKRRGIMKCYGCGLSLCNVCKICHTATCDYMDLKVSCAEESVQYNHRAARTQKVRGFVQLAEAGITTPAPYFVVKCAEDIPQVLDKMADCHSHIQWFARPCPIRPRHGFEESRKLSIPPIAEEITGIFNAAVAADDEHTAELLILPYIDTKYNAIITPHVMAIGPGNDGATAGVNSIAIPLMGHPFPEITPQLLQRARVPEDADPYLEVVYKDYYYDSPLFTQLRAGARVDSGNARDFVPAAMEVKDIIEASGSLLEWEQQVKTIQPGTVVYKLGGTMISHYGVHCLYNQVPCMTSRVPVIGERLEPVGKTPDPDPHAVVRGLGDGLLMPLVEHNIITSALQSMMTILHNAGAMNGRDGYWLGVAAAVMMRCGTAASHGEARHKLSNMGSKRQYVYNLAFKNFLDARNTLGVAQWMFKNLNWSSSYGGKKWADCTQSILDMDAAAQALIAQPTVEHVAALVSGLNVAVNKAHNGGWWLDKFITKDRFDNACKQSIYAVAAAAKGMYEIHEQTAAMERAVVEQFLQEYATLPTIDCSKPGKLQVEGSVSTYHLDDDDSNEESETDCEEPSEDEEDPWVPETKLHTYNVNDSYEVTGNESVVAAQMKLVPHGTTMAQFHIQLKLDTFEESSQYLSVATDPFPLAAADGWKHDKYLSWAPGSGSNTYAEAAVSTGPLWAGIKLTAGGKDVTVCSTLTGKLLANYSYILPETETTDAQTEETEKVEEVVGSATIDSISAITQTLNYETDCPF